MKLRNTLVATTTASALLALAVQAQAGEVTTFPGSNISIGSVEVQQGPFGAVVSAYKQGICDRHRRRCRWGRETYFAPQPSPFGQFANFLGGLGNTLAGAGILNASTHRADSSTYINNGSASFSGSSATAVSVSHARIR